MSISGYVDKIKDFMCAERHHIEVILWFKLRIIDMVLRGEVHSLLPAGIKSSCLLGDVLGYVRENLQLAYAVSCVGTPWYISEAN